ncbi:hypothetical protein [Streptomyces liangshanensis]|uniref:hypothetical protein n=1 Tax=Streptomyces liangshanensis TaxID=2717324 RepID=UPI0036D8E93A
MSQHHVQIRTDGVIGQVLIDGHDVGELPTLRLDLRLIDVTELSSMQAQVLLDHGVAEMAESD